MVEQRNDKLREKQKKAIKIENNNIEFLNQVDFEYKGDIIKPMINV